MPSEAVVWDREGGATVLSSLLVQLRVDLKGARLASAIDVSADETHILGQTSDGFADLAIIPEPAPSLLLLLGLVGLSLVSKSGAGAP